MFPSASQTLQDVQPSSYLLIGFERRFGRLRLRHFVTQEIQHLLGRVPLGHLLAGAHPLRGLAADRHLRGVEDRGEQRQESRRRLREQPAKRFLTCMTNSRRRGRPRSVTMLYSGSFSFLACWICASRLMGFIPWPYSGLVWSCRRQHNRTFSAAIEANHHVRQ